MSARIGSELYVDLLYAYSMERGRNCPKGRFLIGCKRLVVLGRTRLIFRNESPI